MVKPLRNHPKVHLHGLPLDLRRTHSHLKSSVFGYHSDEEDSNEAGDEDYNSPQGSGQVPTKIKQENSISRLTVVSREAKKKQHACASSGPRDHYSEYLHGWQL